MIGTFNLFSSYDVASRRDKIRIANDSLSSIASTDCIPHISSLSLSFIFHVSNFS